jgi:ABC-type glycerol-3-phosphate transport system substrate-binding protein
MRRWDNVQMKRKAHTTVGLMLLVALLLFTACASKGNDNTVKKDGGSTTAFTEPVELNFYHNGGITADQFESQYGSYNKQKLPNVTAKFILKDKAVPLSDMVANGTKIDIFIDSIGQIGLKGSLIDLGLNLDISDLVKKHNVDLNRFDSTTIDAVKVMGGLYGLPISNSTMVIMYNKDIFDKFAVAYPKDGMTWDELTDLSKKLTRNDESTQYVGYSTSINHYLRMNPLSLANVDPQTKQSTFDNEQWKKLIQETLLNPMQADGYKKVVTELSKQWYKIPYTDEFNKSRNVAMFSFMYGDYSWLKDMNYDVVALPSFKDKPKVGSQSYPTYMFVTSTGEHKDAAMEVIKLFLSDEYQTNFSKSGGITTLNNEAIKQVFGQDTQMKDKNIKNAVFYNRPAPATAKTKYDTYVEDAIRSKITPLIMGETDLNTVLRVGQEEVNKKIAENK